MIRRYEGHVAQYLIDGLLAYFCYPQAHEDDAERAVRAGLDILAALDTLNDTLQPEYRVRLAARIGIHTGPVVIGEMGGGAKSGMIALGDVPHMATRLRKGRGQSVVVRGEAGVGKSRLALQLRQHLVRVKHIWLESGATPYAAGTPFHPVIALLAQGLSFVPEDTAAGKLAKIERGLGDLATPEAVALTADLVGLSPPTRLSLSLMGRLDRLSAAKEVAQRAAVLGCEFDAFLLGEVSNLGEAELRRELARLVEAEIVFARGEPPDASYVFKHALIQEAAYQSLLKRTRQELHGAVLDALLRSFPERAAAEPEVVARHAELAGRTGEAITLYERAGRRAQERFAEEEATGHLRRALELLATLPSGGERDAREAGIQLALASSLSNARGLSHSEPRTAYERALALCERRGDERSLCWASVGLSILAFARGDVEQGRSLAADVLAIAERTGDEELALVAHVQIAIPEQFQGKLVSASAHLEAARALYRPELHHAVVSILVNDPGVSTLAFLAACLMGRGWPDQALARAREGVELARRLGHPSSLAQALVFEVAVHWARRDPSRQRDSAREVITLAEAQGLPYFLGLGDAGGVGT